MGAGSSKGDKELKMCHQKFEIVRQLNEDQIEAQLRVTQEDYNNWKSNLKRISSFNKENILLPLNHSFQNEGWCSQNTGLAKITYDNYQFVFEEELENRISLDRHLSEQQMWYLLYTLVSTAKQFSFLNRKVGDIRPHNIFVSQGGQIKLATCFSWPGEITNYEKAYQQKIATYISPQEIQLCKKQKIDSIISLVLSESFSIGLTMLHSGVLFNFSVLYDLKNFQINIPLLQQKIQKWMNLQYIDEDNKKCSYSQSLKQVVKDLCEPNPEKRQSSTNIFEMLNPYKQQILNLQTFEFNYKKPKYLSHFGANFNGQESNSSNFRNSTDQYQPYTQFNDNSTNPHPRNSHQITLNQQSFAPYNGSFNIQYQNNPTMHVATPYNVGSSNRNDNGNFQIFDKYASSSHPLYKTNEIQERFSTTKGINSESRPISSYQFNNIAVDSNKIIAKPVISTSEFSVQKTEHRQSQSNKHFQSYEVSEVKMKKQTIQNFGSNVGSTHSIPVHNGHLDYDPSDFLKKIDQQLRRSKDLFPS